MGERGAAREVISAGPRSAVWSRGAGVLDDGGGGTAGLGTWDGMRGETPAGKKRFQRRPPLLLAVGGSCSARSDRTGESSRREMRRMRRAGFEDGRLSSAGLTFGEGGLMGRPSVDVVGFGLGGENEVGGDGAVVDD